MPEWWARAWRSFAGCAESIANSPNGSTRSSTGNGVVERRRVPGGAADNARPAGSLDEGEGNAAGRGATVGRRSASAPAGNGCTGFGWRRSAYERLAGLPRRSQPSESSFANQPAHLADPVSRAAAAGDGGGVLLARRGSRGLAAHGQHRRRDR